MAHYVWVVYVRLPADPPHNPEFVSRLTFHFQSNEAAVSVMQTMVHFKPEWANHWIKKTIAFK